MAPDNLNGGYATAEGILAAPDMAATEDVEAPEWGGKVKVRALSMQEVLDIRKAATAPNGATDERLVVVNTFVRAFVVPVLDMAQAEALMAKAAHVNQRVLVAINRLNGMDASGQPGVAAAQVAFPEASGPTAGTGPGAGPGHDAAAPAT